LDVGFLEFQGMVGGAKIGVARRRSQVVGRSGAADRGGDGKDEQCQHERLTLPLAPEETPSPSNHGTTGGDSSIIGCL
jgi:hypothetical protein